MSKNTLKNQPKTKLSLKRKLVILAFTGISLSAILYTVYTVIGFNFWPDDSFADTPVTTPGSFVVPIDAPVGPAGVGTQSTNTFWYRGDQLVNAYSDGDAVTTWTNQGGSTKDAYQNSSNKRPVLHTSGAHSINGYPALYFDGSNDFMTIANNSDMNVGGSWTHRTISMVFRTGPDVQSRQFLFEEGGGVRGLNIYIYQGQLYYGAWNKAQSHWGFFYVSTPIVSNEEYIVNLIFAGTDGETGTVECYLNEAHVGTMNNVGRLHAHSGNNRIGASGNSHVETGSIGSGYYFEGDLAEFIVHSYALNNAERIVMNNSLSAKYDIALTVNDNFALDDQSNGNFDHELAGFGSLDLNNSMDDAQGIGIVRMFNSEDLNEGEFILWAHDNGTTNINQQSDVPPGTSARMHRVWALSELDTNGNGVDVGLLDVVVDINNLYNTTPNELQLIVDTDNDNSFADEFPIDGLLTNSANQFVFQDVGLLGNGSHFTFGVSGGTFLPIELGEFDAQMVGESVQIDWNTLSQSNNDYFTIEHSTDGENYAEIGRIDGAGDASINMDYQFFHDNPLPGLNYYRLMQTDFNGDFEIFDPVTVKYETEINSLTITSVAPNPFEYEFTVKYHTEFRSEVEIILVDLNGVQIFKDIQMAEIGANQFTYSEGYDLKPGMYIIQIIQGTEQATSTKIIKQ